MRITIPGMDNKASKWLIDRRKERGVSLRQLAALTGLTHTTIANAEAGDATASTWLRLAEYFGESPSNVLSWAGLLKERTERDELTEQIIHLLEGLEDEEKELLINIIPHIRKKKDVPSNGETRRR